MTSEIVNSRKARAIWRELLDRVLVGDHDVVIERNGQPVAVLIPVSDYEDLQIELDELRISRRASTLLQQWRDNPSLSRPVDDFERELIAEGYLNEREKDLAN